MSLQNRVRPDGDLIALSARGSLMGNRGGRIHDPTTASLGSRRWASSRWICCSLEFKNRRRIVWGESYTELFFLDEVTSLSAGHRPCYECRRHDAHAFADAVARSCGMDRRPTAAELDRRLHSERLEGRAKRLHPHPFAALPDGAMLVQEGGFYAVQGSHLLRWSPNGYTHSLPRPTHGTAQTLTPPTALAALAAGFRPGRA